ncbi:MAG: hypothetical protein ABL921_09115 [Pirellula sp.]
MERITHDPQPDNSRAMMTKMDVAIPAVFRRSLEDQRDVLNALFRSRVEQGARIDPDAFAEHVRTRISNNIAAIDLVMPERTRLATAELFEVSLELFAVGQFGNGTNAWCMSALWEELMPTIAPFIAREPRRVAGSLSNALVQIETQSAQSAKRWLNLIAQLNQCAGSVDELLILGKVAAWVSGMSHYRRSALAAARMLPGRTVARLFGLNPDSDEIEVREFLSRLAEDPWCDSLEARPGGEREVRQVGLCGAFRGFGGSLMKPPSVATIDGKLMVSDGQHGWQIFADRFGSVLQSVVLEPFQGNVPRAKPNPHVNADGTIHWNRKTTTRPDLAGSSSYAFDGTTLAVTIPNSFHVFLFARTSLPVPPFQIQSEA